MKKVILVCGKICSGKTTYAKRLMKELKAVHLSCDEITLSLFGQNIGDQHDEIVARTINYLLHKSLEILAIDVPVILDFGFWQQVDREEANFFYEQHGIKPEWHYVSIDNSTWLKNIEKRNAEILNDKTGDYFVDQPLAEKFGQMFEPPSKNEIDIWFENNWSE